MGTNKRQSTKADKNSSETDLTFEKGLPANIDAERFVLGSVLTERGVFPKIAENLEAEDFSMEKHRRIFLRMKELFEMGMQIDRVTLCEQLQKQNQLESVDGLSYLVTLDEGMPVISNIESYVKIVREKAALRRVIFTFQKGIDRALMGDSTADEIVESSQTSITGIQKRLVAGETVESAEEYIAGYEGGFDRFMSPHLRARGIPTGFRRLDDLIGGWRSKTSYILAGDTSWGKSSLGANFGTFAAKQGTGVLYYSAEMTKESLLHRIIAAEAGVSYHRWQTGDISKPERVRLAKAAWEVRKLPIYIDDESAPTMRDIYTKTWRKTQDSKVGLVIIDYLQIMNMSVSGWGEKFKTEYDAIGFLANKLLVEMPKDLNVPVIVISQFSRARRAREKKQQLPRLSDLHGNSNLEKRAHVVLFIYRPEAEEGARDAVKGQADLIVKKQRNGPTGIAKLKYLHWIMKFVENETGDSEPPVEVREDDD